MSIKLILLLLVVYIMVVASFGLFIAYSDRKKKRSRHTTYSRIRRTSSSEIIYGYMMKLPICKHYIAKISRRYEMLCPGRLSDIAKKTMSLTCFTFGLCMLVLIFIYFLHPSLEHFILSIYMIFVINNEIINYYVTGVEIKLRMEQELFISNISRNFFHNYYIDDAILKAMEAPMSSEMKEHAKALYDITISNHIKEEVERYHALSHDKFMKMLLSLCVNVVERGDGSEIEYNRLAANLMHLKKEINLDYLKMKKLQFIFSGSVFAAVVVCLPISAIQEFGLYISPELISFYRGMLGILYIGLVYLCSFLVYVLTNNAKEVKRPAIRDYWYLRLIEKNGFVKLALNNFNEKNYGRMMQMRETLKRLGETITPNQLLIKCTLISSIAFCLSVSFVLIMHVNTKNLILKNINNVDAFSATATEEQLSLVKETIQYYTEQYKEKAVTMDELRSEVSGRGLFQNERLNEKISTEVMLRVEKMKKEYFKYYELMICLGISVVAAFTPYWLILYRKKLMLSVMEDEVVQFNSIIFMMMNSEYITVADILEQMEIFAVVFKSSIRECLNEYNSGDIDALEKLRERETNASFRHLVSNLIRCDDIPIRKAFHEITADRENYFERRKQEDEFSLQRKADSVKPLAFLPGILVMIYLVLPVVVMSLKALKEVVTLLKDTGMY